MNKVYYSILILLFIAISPKIMANEILLDRFQSYIDESINQFEATDSFIINKTIRSQTPYWTIGNTQQRIAWNNASLTINLNEYLENGNQIVENSFGDLFILLEKNKGAIRIIAGLPLKFSGSGIQNRFLNAVLKTSKRHSNYTIKKSKLINSKSINVQEWIELTETNEVKHSTNLQLILFFLILLTTYILILKGSKSWVDKMGDFSGSLLVFALFLLARIIFESIISMDTIVQHEIFEHSLNTNIFSQSLGEFFLNMTVFFFISIFLLRQFSKRSIGTVTKLTENILLISSYSIILGSFILFTRLVRDIIINSKIDFQFEKIYAFDWNTHIFITGILLFIASLFFLTYLFIKKLSSTGAPLGKRVIAFFVSTLITFFLFNKAELNISAFGFYLLVLSIIFLMDLFVETKRKSISWLIVWLVTITSGITSLIYTYNNKSYGIEARQIAKDIENKYVESVKSNTTFNYKLENKLEWLLLDQNKKLLHSSELVSTNFSSTTSPKSGEFILNKKNGKRELIYSLENDYLIIVSQKHNTIIQFIALFSFLFTSLCLVLLIILILNTLTHVLPQNWNLLITNTQSIRRRIQFVIFSILIISFAAVFMVTYLYLRNYRQELLIESREGALQKAIYDINLASESIHYNKDGTVNFELIQKINPKIQFFSDKGNSININKNFNFPIYSVPYALVRNDSSKTNESPIQLMINLGDSQKLIYRKLAVLGRTFYYTIPYPKAINEESSIINNLLGSLLNIYIFLFVIASSIALTFSDTITSPLRHIREKLSSIKFGKSNEPIQWDSNDEFGDLIKDYNKMLENLEKSANTLAMTERELAWREMARQIAHEIKNPLTPMKLNIQYLQMAIKKDASKAKELTDRISKTLLEQIDNLSHIASEFSNFAVMPTAENEKVILNDIVTSVHDLFRKRDDITINLYVPIDDIVVFADKHYLRRIIINLLKNAIQAIPPDRKGWVKINVFKEEDNAIVTVEDNGSGISDEIKHKIFQPNFTSKNSGTGLGLAISANIVESFNGKIYFETFVNKGTIFYIEIPLMHTENNFKEENRVIL